MITNLCEPFTVSVTERELVRDARTLLLAAAGLYISRAIAMIDQFDTRDTTMYGFLGKWEVLPESEGKWICVDVVDGRSNLSSSRFCLSSLVKKRRKY